MVLVQVAETRTKDEAGDPHSWKFHLPRLFGFAA